MPFGYLFYASFFGLFNFDHLEFLALHWNQNTDPYCLLYSPINTWRIAIPISYNFISIMGIEECQFLKVMGPVRLIPFIGRTLNEYVFPLCLIFTIVFTLTDGYNRIRRCFGYKNSYISADDTVTSEKITDGKYIIEKYREEKLGERTYVSKIDGSYDTIDSSDLLSKTERS